MARKRTGSPRLTLTITPDDRQKAIDSHSHGCLIAEAIKRAGYVRPTVDMATIRFTDPEAGERYTYLSPDSAQMMLLGLDQGWPMQEDAEIKLSRAVKITPVIDAPTNKTRREARIAELEVKEVAGTLTRVEKTTLTRMRTTAQHDRPSSRGKAKIVDTRTVAGGDPLPQGKPHPNLLRGRNRIFGAKLADPGKAFQEAVDATVAARLAEHTAD